MSLNAGSTRELRVVIIDDHAMIVEVISEILGKLSGFKVVGHAASCREAQTVCQGMKPDFVILDVGLPDASGLEAFRQIKALLPQVRVLIISGNLNDWLIKKALVAGVDGIISKTAATSELRTAILNVSAGRSYLCNQTSDCVRRMVHTPATPPAPKLALSKREQTVLRHIATGLSSREIAAKLGLSPYTVNNFRSKLFKKTGLHRAAQLSLYAARIGLIKDPLGSAHPGW
jgi:DNA-binding NarL/FixJ family response regulator